MFGINATSEKLEGSFGTFKDEADNLLRNMEFRKAVDCYTKALKFRPTDKVCLIKRSKCYLMLGDCTLALRDAETSLQEDGSYYRGIYQKAEALFGQGDFEMALVFYHRGQNMRPELQNFLVGIKKAQQAIYNSVGTPDRIKLTTTGDLSFFQSLEEKKVRKTGALCTRKQQAVLKRVLPTPKRGSERTIKQMLGDLYGDKIYLENLLKRADNKTATGRKVRSVAKKELDYLDNQAAFWQQVKPIYAIKYEARQAQDKVRSFKIATHDYVIKELEKIDLTMTEGNFELALKRAQKLLTLVDSYTQDQLASKMIFKAAINSAIGSAFLELKDYENAERHHLIDLELGENCYIEEAERRALDNLGRVHVGSGNILKAIEVWERRLPMSREPIETTWLCHELGRCYLSQGEFRQAMDYGGRSLAAAQEAKDYRWQLHALVLISQAEAKSRHFSSALINFEKALEIASLLKDADAEETINKAIAGVNYKILQRELHLDTVTSLVEAHRAPENKDAERVSNDQQQ